MTSFFQSLGMSYEGAYYRDHRVEFCLVFPLMLAGVDHL
jgi:hypothetical protein